MTMLDGRLQAAADFVTPGGAAVDVGTDHGYLPVYLVESGRVKRALAADINSQPLESARRNIAEAGLEDQIGVLQTDGLDGIDLEQFTDVILAGMGGMLIAEILERRMPLAGLNLILQPMTQAPFLRRWLCEKGFQILAETPAQAAGKVYAIINARYDGQVRECSELFAHVGKIPEKLGDPVKGTEALLYLRTLRHKLEIIALGMSQSERDPGGAGRYRQLAEQIQKIEEGRE